MTILGHESSCITDNFGHALEVLVSGCPDPFWDDVRRHVTAWLIISSVASVGYLAVQVPIRLDRVLNNQEGFTLELQEFKAALKDLEVRVARQEQSRQR
jgi:hypothetical protein